MIGKALIVVVKVILWLFLLLFVLAFFGWLIIPLVQVLFTMLVGWGNFLSRVLPEVSLNPSAIAIAIICSGLLVWGVQRFCGWLYGHYRVRQAADSPWPAVWPWRWTVGIYCGLWLLFLASMSVTGVTHQIGWLVRSGNPVFELQRRYDLQRAADHVRTRCERTGWNSRTVRAACEEAGRIFSPRGGESLEEHWQMIFIENGAGAMAVVFLAHRDPGLRIKHGYQRVTPTGVTAGPIDRLPGDIRTFSVKVEPSAN